MTDFPAKPRAARSLRRSPDRRLLLWFLLLPLTGVGLTAFELYLKRNATDRTATEPEVVWVYSPPEPGAIVSSPWVGGGRVYTSVIRDKGLHPGGAILALDEERGKPVWTFDDDGAMIHMYSSPHVASGKLFVGEGMHANFDCKLTCLDSETGKKLWRFPATSHLESTPCTGNGLVYFGAGDDGVYAVDIETGERRWQFNPSLHIDSSPAIFDGKVIIGSGVSRRFRTTKIVALDAQQGTIVWQLPVELPAWGSPVIAGGRVYIGLGNGRLDRSHDQPRGELLCLDAGSGQRIWARPLPDDVGPRVALDAERVYLGCRDGHVYALSRDDGRELWKHQTGSPVVTTPDLLDGRVYVTASAGRVVCLNAADGGLRASFDAAKHAGTECRLWSSPAVRVEAGGRHRVYFGCDLRFPGASAAALYCVRFPQQ